MAGQREKQRARKAVAQHGALLVYPIQNRPDLPSLWSVLYPNVTMEWAWDADADGRVAELWGLREELARERELVYAKWFRGRATFFSQALYEAMLATQRATHAAELSREARRILSLLEEDSPQSAKNLRREAELSGRDQERDWTRSLKALWERLLIVGVGEEPDGAFPSLRIGATRWVFEELWQRAGQGVTEAHRAQLAAQLGPKTPFGRYFLRSLTSSKRV